MKILILFSYFQRPILVKNALRSVLAANELHEDWVMFFHDDGSKIPGRPIVEDILKDHLHKIDFSESGMSIDEKLDQGLTLGRTANKTMLGSDADIAFILCDDDELVPSYLKNLSDYFTNNKETLYCYSKLYLYNPLVQHSDESSKKIVGKYNQWHEPVDPSRKLDASQVAWRLSCCKDHGAWFRDTTQLLDQKPWAKDIDHSFFENLYRLCGPCHPTGFVGQFKGIHDQQLLWHKTGKRVDLVEYDQWCKEKGGKEF